MNHIGTSNEEGIAMKLASGTRFALGRNIALKNVPLEVVNALTNQLTRDGSTRRLTVGALDSVTRRGGQGNHSWFVDLNDRGTLRTFKGSWGGRGKQGPTVVEIAAGALGRRRG